MVDRSGVCFPSPFALARLGTQFTGKLHTAGPLENPGGSPEFIRWVTMQITRHPVTQSMFIIQKTLYHVRCCSLPKSKNGFMICIQMQTLCHCLNYAAHLEEPEKCSQILESIPEQFPHCLHFCTHYVTLLYNTIHCKGTHTSLRSQEYILPMPI